MTNSIDFTTAQILSTDTVNLRHIGPVAEYALSVVDPKAHDEWLTYWGHNGDYIWGQDVENDNDAWNDLFDCLNSFASTVNSWFGFSEFDGAVLGFWPNTDDDGE